MYVHLTFLTYLYIDIAMVLFAEFSRSCAEFCSIPIWSAF